MQELHDAVCRNTSVIQTVAARLRSKATCLYGIGMDSLAETLDQAAGIIVASAKDVQDATSREVTTYVNSTDRMSSLLVEAALAGFALTGSGAAHENPVVAIE